MQLPPIDGRAPLLADATLRLRYENQTHLCYSVVYPVPASHAWRRRLASSTDRYL